MSASINFSRSAPGPYPGLRPFTRDEAKIFFGRDDQIDQLLEKLKSTRFLTVVGPSGCGKSSLVRAGMIADLEGGLMSETGAHWEFVEMRPGKHPMSALADALLAEEPLRSRLLPRSLSSDEMQSAVGFLRAALRVGPLGLVDLLRQSRLPDRTNFLLLVDQFEEVFAARNEGFVDETDAFVALLLTTASQRELPLYVVITMRSDYLGNCPVFSCLPEAINQGQYLTPRLDREQRTEAIVGPAKLFGATIDADLVNHLLNETGPSPDQLPLLQHLLMRMWTLASNDGNVPKNGSTKLTLNFDHYAAAGGFEQAISKHAEEAYNELTERQKEIAQVLFRALCERGPDNREKRRLVTVETIAALAGTTPEEVIAVADVFRRQDRSFIMPPTYKALSADMDLDISHEALIRNWDKLSRWVGIEAKSAENYLWLEEAARRWKNREAGLFYGSNLKTALKWREQEKPSKRWAARYGGDFSLAMEFLNRSQENYDERLRQKAAHRRNVFVGISAAVVGALVVAAVVCWLYMQKIVMAEVNSRANVSLARNSQKAGNDGQALGYLAEALRQNQENYAATAFATAMLSQSGWPLCVAALMQDGSAISSAQFSPDSQLVLTGNSDGTARLWDLTAKGSAVSQVVLLGRHESAVTAVGISPDNHWLVTGSADKTARLWDARTGKPVGEPMKHDDGVTSARFSPDGKRVVTASLDWTARLWDALTGEPIGEPMKHEYLVNSAEFSPDGKRVVTASFDWTAQLWDALTGEPIGEPMKHERGVNSAQFSPDGKWVVTASLDRTARLWDALTGKPKTTKKGEPIKLKHDGEVTSAQFSPDGARVVTASQDGKVRLWDAQTGEPIGEPMKHEGVVYTAQFSPDGQRVVTASGDGTARLWNAASGKVLGEPMQHLDPVDSAQFSPDGQWVMTASADGIARLWDAASCEAISESMRHAGPVYSARFSPDGQRVVTASEETARLWEVASGKPIGEPMKHDGVVYSAQFSPDGQRVVTASLDKTARLWEAASGKPIGELMKHDGVVYSAQFSPDGQRVVTASLDKTARLWEAASGKPIGELMKHDGAVYSAQFSPNGQRVVTASRDGKVRIWDALTGKEIGEPMKHPSGVYLVQFSPDGQRVVTASWDKTARLLNTTVRLWNAANGEAIGKPIQHRGRINSAEFSPDSQRVVTASDDGTARLWNALTGKEIGEAMKHAAGVYSAHFSPDGRRAVTASADGTARLWDTQTSEEIGEPMKHEKGVNSAWFSPDSQRVVTASEDETAQLWDVPAVSRKAPPKDVRLLVDLSEATGGVTIKTSLGADIRSALTPKQVKETREKIAANLAGTSSELSPLQRCLKWSVLEPRSRTISPFSEITLAEWEENRINEGTLDGLRATVQVEPANARLAAHFGRRLAQDEEGTDLAEVQRTVAEADFQMSRAVKLAPDNHEVQKLCAEESMHAKLSLGRAYTEQAKQTEGAEATDLLAQAVAAYHSALEVYTREESPQDWAMTQYNLGVALHGLGTRGGAKEGPMLLTDAVAAFRSALEVYTKADLPQDWARTQNNLGAALWTLGDQLEGKEGMNRQRESVEAFREVLAYQPSDQSRLMLAQDLGNFAFNLVLNRQFAEAQTQCEEAQRLANEIGDGIQKTDRDDLILIQQNLAHALLFQGHYDEALAIYLQNWEKPLNGKTFGETTLEDFAAFDKAGLTHPDLSRMKRALEDLPSKAPSP